MARPDEKHIAKAMKEAKTAQDIVMSWITQAPERDAKAVGKPLRLWMERKPEMIKTFAHNQLTQVIDRGILDKKTRYLVILGVYMALRHWEGIVPQCCNAKAAGATDEEIMEVAFLVDYGVSKTWMVEMGEALGNAFENPSYKKTKQR